MPDRQERDVDYYLDILDKNMLFYGRELSRRIITRAKGSYIYDWDGQPIIDFSSGQMCATLGHSHDGTVAAILRATREVMHLESTKMAPAVLELAHKLVELTGGKLTRALFLSTGAESNEAAIKMSKTVTGNYEVVGIANSFHGVTTAAASATYSKRPKSAGPMMPGSLALPEPNCFRCPIRHCTQQCDTTCLDVGIEFATRQSTGDVAAVIIEPIQSSGGIIVTPRAYMDKLRDWCKRIGAMLIFDEAQTGLGRTGRRFGYELYGFVPDIVTLSKTLGAGIPLAAVLSTDRIDAQLREGGFNFYTSHVSDPLPAYVGCAVIDTILEEDLAGRAATMGRYLKDRLLELKQRYEVIGDVRGEGMLLGVEIVRDAQSRLPDVALLTRITAIAYEKGLSLSKAGGGNAVWRIAPPLTIDKEDIDLAVDIMDSSIREALRSP
jgi:2,2-dialkylglycine decarboxylase (pyruvate)